MVLRVHGEDVEDLEDVSKEEMEIPCLTYKGLEGKKEPVDMNQ